MRPETAGRIDYMGGFAVTAGHGVRTSPTEFKAKHDDYSAIMAKSLGDRLAEALAEMFHKRVPAKSCGYGRTKISTTRT